MPQLDPASFSSQLFWLTISFVVLYVVLSHFLLPRVQSVLSVRANTIGSDISQAAKMKSEAEQVYEHYEKALATARAKSHDMLADAQAIIAQRAAKQQADLDKVLEAKLADSASAIRAAKHDVMEKLAPVSAELTSLIVEVLVHHKPNPKEIGTVISDISKERMV